MRKTKASRAVVIFAAVMVAALMPATPAGAAPAVKFLNPSDYSSPLRISAKEDANGDTTYHLVVWAADVPSNPFVEFELSPSPAPLPNQEDPAVIATVNGSQSDSNDTFQGSLPLTMVPDGQYFLRAILYGGFLGPGTGTEVARDQVSVTVQSSAQAAANTVEMAYPENGGPLGFWGNGDKADVAVLTGFASAGTAQVRALYTTSNPGTDPAWTECGSGAVSNRSFAVRCALAADVNSSAVKAVAAVANQTPPPAPATAGADETGDAHRVVPYTQDPTTLTFDPPQVGTDQNKCTALTATVKDQSGIPMAAVNVDVHAQGPDDQLRFATQFGVSSGFQPPDAAHTGNEPTTKCATTDDANQQGDHNVAGGNDTKHIESTAGTNNHGQFTMVLIAGTRGGTHVTAWPDENDDDSLNTSEASGTAQVGWGTVPPPQTTNLNIDPSALTATVHECQRLTAVAEQGGNPQSGKNVDIHISGPNGVGFCNPGDSGTSQPDSGGHAGDVDPGQENTHHAEGTTNSSGALVFGVTSPNPGTTNVMAWLDDNNNDTAESNETVAAGTVEWREEGGRSISISSNKSSVQRGRKVTLSGDIDAASACANSQGVKIQRSKGGSFRTIKTVVTNEQGNYSAKVKVKKTKRYRALAPKNGPCEKARSSAIKVKAT